MELKVAFEKMDFLELVGNFKQGRMNQKMSLTFSDRKLDTLFLLANLMREPKVIEPAKALHQKTRLRAERGDVDAMCKVGIDYLIGRGVEVDKNKGWDWVQRSAWLHNPDAQFLIGKLYSDGRDVPKHMGKSYFWLSLAARQGHKSAIALKPGVAAQLTEDERAKIDQQVLKSLKND